jgi:hypothetical protein
MAGETVRMTGMAIVPDAAHIQQKLQSHRLIWRLFKVRSEFIDFVKLDEL